MTGQPRSRHGGGDGGHDHDHGGHDGCELNKQPHHGNVRSYSAFRRITSVFPIAVIKYHLAFSHLDFFPLWKK